MDISFAHIPREANVSAIYSQAGKMFKEQAENDRVTDYTMKEHFEKAMYFLAEKAVRRGFYALRGMSIEAIADAISESVLKWVREK